MRTWSEYRDFFREFRRNFHNTGALLPSGIFLAQELARPLTLPRLPARILEVGPGTGSVTREIVRRMQPGDLLDAVEINAAFVEILKGRFERDQLLASHRDDVRIIHAPVQEVIGEGVYDFIISGLPLNNFNRADIRSIFTAYSRLARPGATLSYFEYVLLRALKPAFVGRAERYRLARVGRLVRRYIRRHQTGSRHVWLNVPPAVVRYLRLGVGARVASGVRSQGSGVSSQPEDPGLSLLTPDP
jgi:phospholipid N-methyltransferase